MINILKRRDLEIDDELFIQLLNKYTQNNLKKEGLDERVDY